MSNGTPDSPVADRFIEADGTRFCRPGDEASRTCRPLTSPRPVSRIVIHALSVRGTPERSAIELIIDRWQNPVEPDHIAGAHYLVDRDGTVTQMVSEGNVAFHAGDQQVNRDSIGIEHADICNDPAPLTIQLYERSAELVRDIVARHGIVVDQNTIVGHEQAVGDHDDPGAYWDFEYYFLLLNWDGVNPEARPLRAVAMAAEQSGPPLGWEVTPRRKILDEFCARRGDPYGAHFWHVNPDVASGFDPASFQFEVSETGLYKISLWWPRFADATPAIDTPVNISLVSDVESSAQNVSANQTLNVGQWNDLGSPFNVIFPPATVTVSIGIAANISSGTLLADAVRLLRIG